MSPLSKTKNNDHSCETDEEADDAGVGPCVGCPSPLKRKEEHNNRRDEDGSAYQVELSDTLGDAVAGGVVFAVDVEVEEYACYYYRADWEAGKSMLADMLW